MLNSPHGWSSWKTYATWYLYLLTGEEALLRQTMDTLGACVQAIDVDSAELRWGFISDPCIATRVFRQDAQHPGQGSYTEEVLGEEYIEMISGWWQAPEGEATGGYWEQGGCCDNDVHEHFKCLEEVALTSAYVIEHADGSLAAWNCRARWQGSELLVEPAEDGVTGVHLNLRGAHPGRVVFAGAAATFSGAGMFWVQR
jgi:hypothetical protein